MRSEQKAQREFGSGVGRGQFLGLAEFGFGRGEIEVGCQQYEAERFVRSGEIGRERQGGLRCVPRLGIGLVGFRPTQPGGGELSPCAG